MNPAKRLLRALVDVQKREVEPALLFFSFWFLVIITFQILKPLKKGYFVDALGAGVELYAKLANIGVAIAVVILFTALYNRMGSRRLILSLVSLFAAVLLGFAAIVRSGAPSPPVNWALYLFGDAWSTVWVTTFWAYLTELTRPEQSKRLYGLIGGGGVVGGLVGGAVVWKLVQPLGASTLLVGCALLTSIIGLIVWRVEALTRSPEPPIQRSDTDRLHLHTEGRKMNAAIEGAKLVMASRYLLAIALIVFLYELVSQILDYQYSSEAEQLAGAGATQAFFGKVTAIIGVVSVITQFVLVSFIIRTFGVTTALLVLPVAMAMASGVYLVMPVLWVGALLTISDNAFSYSINQTARETLFVPTSAEVKYKARAFANMFVQRVGKGIAILMALALASLPIRFLSILAIAVIAVWAGFAIYAGRRFDQLTAPEAEPRPGEDRAR